MIGLVYRYIVGKKLHEENRIGKNFLNDLESQDYFYNNKEKHLQKHNSKL